MRPAAAVALASAALLLAREFHKGAVRPTIDPRCAGRQHHRPRDSGGRLQRRTETPLHTMDTELGQQSDMQTDARCESLPRVPLISSLRCACIPFRPPAR